MDIQQQAPQIQIVLVMNVGLLRDAHPPHESTRSESANQDRFMGCALDYADFHASNLGPHSSAMTTCGLCTSFTYHNTFAVGTMLTEVYSDKNLLNLPLTVVGGEIRRGRAYSDVLQCYKLLSMEEDQSQLTKSRPDDSISSPLWTS